MSASEYQHVIRASGNSPGSSLVNVLRAIADDKSLVLFNNIALGGGVTDILLTRLGLSRKQYYSRISALLKAGLISRKNRQFHLTSLGMIVYDSQLMIGRAVKTFWKLKAIDALEKGHKLPLDQRNKIVNTLVDDQDIIKILVKQSRAI